ncbi:hypothetical protein GCM10023322_24190 [Rugosimonospora acidiphila]|uniref:Carotenoid biosynthesis protein n=1 Tax=Rugosimonospora acidiphila TaxID=556531 RepID=A0ABP9RRH9_9ACTN
MPLGGLVLIQIGYPLTHGDARAGLVVTTVLLGFAISVGHALATRGARVAVALVVVAGAGGLAVEALGVRTGFPFGRYAYSGALGPRLFGVPLVIPLAWAWMAWPAWLAAARLTRPRAGRTARARTGLAGAGLAGTRLGRTGLGRTGLGRAGLGRAGLGRAGLGRAVVRIALAGLGLAAWDLFLDPQMVAAGYWRWRHPTPGLAGIPYTNYLGWLVVAVLMMALFAAVAGSRVRVGGPGVDAPMSALYLWTYLSSVLAHAVFLGLPGSAAAGAVGMGLVAVPLAVALW